jgi:L-fuculose-phosphate aldolase
MCPGTSGNLSVRIATGMLITPSGVAYDRLTPEQLVALDLDGGSDSGQLAPSSEWPLHRAILRAQPGIAAIVHTHSTFATALACCRQRIPPFHYMVAAAGGNDIPCADYATYGSEELARNAVAALRERRACLLANHGVVAVGSSIEKAEALALEVENLARQFAASRALGEPVLLDDAEMERVLERYATYGQQRA